ncbi:unnamed protein product [Arabidopsis arenosa]|uniref:DUF4283 domain-containing protein n=1 Tax=Arabidopsis arenosa TaxID=38785 RepID=A0A8S2AK60_ARAAE|nr:unnamed protein product [Arabidopsis arenosa]
MFTDKGLEFLASAVGEPKRLHPKTESCVKFDEAQILVVADLTKDLPSEYVFTGEEEGEVDSIIKYSYPWLPPRCTGCKKWGHLRSTCLSTKTTESQVIENSEPTPVDALEKTGASLNLSGTEHVDMAKAATEKKVEEEKEAEEGTGWITPKNGRSSPGKRREDLKFGEVSILSNSYSVLGVEDETVVEQAPEETGPLLPVLVSTNKQSESAPAQETVTKGRAAKAILPLRPSLPRDSKTAHKTVSHLPASSARDPSRDQSKKIPPKHI